MQTAVSPGEFRRYAAPGVLGMIGISCYILADTFFVAKGTGSLGLAALNIAIPAYNLMNGLGLMVGVGGATHYSLCRAQGDAAEADRTFTHTLLLGLCIALVFVLTGTFGVVPLVEAARRERRNARYDGRLSAAAAVLRALFRDEQYHDRLRPQRRRTRPRDGRHDRRKPVQHRVRLGIHLSVRSRHVRRGARDRRIAARQPARALRPPARPSRGFHLRRERLRPRLLPRICAPGLSSLVSELASGITLLLINLVLLRIAGNTAVAAYGVIANLALVETAIFTGLSTGVQPLISRSAEADRRRLLRWTVTTALVISALMYVLVFVFASPITAVFNSEHDPALAACAVPGLRIYFAGFLAACINIIAAAYFSAAGQASRGFIISLVRSIIAIPPVLFALSALLGVTGVWLTFPAVEALACVLSLLFILRSPK